MRESLLGLLACPKCQSNLSLRVLERGEGERIREGVLTCNGCSAEFKVTGFIPRFVPQESYADSFGLQWNTYSRTQFDVDSGIELSRDRFEKETKFGKALDGQLILEAGSGAGRFTCIACETGATVVSFDLSTAVEANYRSNGHLDNLLLVQASIYEMPFRSGVFDKIFCLGVIQHTPDPKRAFLSLLEKLRPGGRIAIDVYKKTLGVYFGLKYWLRPITTRMPKDRLFALTKRYIDLMWPLATRLQKVPRGTMINWMLCIPDYSYTGLEPLRVKEWAYLDAYDMLGPKYDIPQTLRQIKRWFSDARMSDVEVHFGYNGIEARGRKESFPN